MTARLTHQQANQQHHHRDEIVPCLRVDAKLLESAPPPPAYTPFVQGGTIPISWLVHADPSPPSPKRKQPCPPQAPPAKARLAAHRAPPKERAEAARGKLPDAVIVCDAKASELRPHEPNSNNNSGKVRACACKRCGFVSESASEVAAHTRRGARCGQKCLWPGCSNSYTNPSLLRVHVRKHTKERPFKCEFCPSEFMQSGDLVRHKRTHTGERPFVCEHCGSTFAVSSTLKRHLQTHHGVECTSQLRLAKANRHMTAVARVQRARRFVCDALGCGEQFACSHDLAAHQHNHNHQHLR